MFKLKNIKYKTILEIDQLKIPEKAVTCVVGESGGGKTTFLKLLNNMISIDKGKVRYKNKNLDDYNPVYLRREIVMLPQEPTVFPETIEDNFKLTIEYAELDNIKNSNFKFFLDKVGLNKELNVRAEKLSGGEKQRLALARTLLLKPEVLLLDEPSSALDEKTEDEIINMTVNFMNNINGTIIMVTHSREIAEKYGDFILTINDGKVIKKE